jgi:hypothetical protein
LRAHDNRRPLGPGDDSGGEIRETDVGVTGGDCFDRVNGTCARFDFDRQPALCVKAFVESDQPRRVLTTDNKVEPERLLIA